MAWQTVLAIKLMAGRCILQLYKCFELCFKPRDIFHGYSETRLKAFVLTHVWGFYALGPESVRWGQLVTICGLDTLAMLRCCTQSACSAGWAVPLLRLYC
jgi:hypothetical protein